MKTFFLKLWKALKLPKNIQLIIMRIFQQEFLVGVTGIVFNDKNEILLFKHSYRQHQWSLPGGYMRAREHPAEGMEREIEEESGFIVSMDKEIKIRTDRETARLDICYSGIYIGGDFKQSAEVKEYRFFSFDNLPSLPTKQILIIQEAIKTRK